MGINGKASTQWENSHIGFSINLTRKYYIEANLSLKSKYSLVDETGLDAPKVDETAVDKIAVDEPGPNPL